MNLVYYSGEAHCAYCGNQVGTIQADSVKLVSFRIVSNFHMSVEKICETPDHRHFYNFVLGQDNRMMVNRIPKILVKSVICNQPSLFYDYLKIHRYSRGYSLGARACLSYEVFCI